MDDADWDEDVLDLDEFLRLTDEHFTPVFTEWGFVEAPLVNGINYYFRRFSRNGSTFGILYERHGGYTDLRFASSLELAPFGDNVAVLARRLGMSIDHYLNVITATPIDIHYEYLAREVLPKVRTFIVNVSAKPHDGTRTRATPHPNLPLKGEGIIELRSVGRKRLARPVPTRTGCAGRGWRRARSRVHRRVRPARGRRALRCPARRSPSTDGARADCR
jgi:hypothetical protein